MAVPTARLSLLILVIGSASAFSEPFINGPLHPPETKRHVGKFRDVKGDVTQVTVNKDGSVFLGLHARNAKPVFTAIIPAATRHRFDQAKKPFVGHTGDPRKIVGKTVWMRGRITLHDRTPHMIIAGPGDFAIMPAQHVPIGKHEVTIIRVVKGASGREEVLVERKVRVLRPSRSEAPPR